VGVCAEIRVPTRFGRISAASVPLRGSKAGGRLWEVILAPSPKFSDQILELVWLVEA